MSSKIFGAGYWGLLNPALFWLLFLPPFLAFGMGYRLAPFWAVVAVIAGVAMLFRQPDRPFSFAFYLGPLLCLFCAYLFEPRYSLMALLVADTWMNFAAFFNAGKSGGRIYESLFSAKTLGVMLILYITILMLWDLKWLGSEIYMGWIPAAILLLVYLIRTAYYFYRPMTREVVMLLPTVRVAVIRGDTLLVRSNDEGTSDLPFSFVIHPGEVPYEVAERNMRTLTSHTPKFLLKYREKVGNDERVVYLFVLNLKHGESFDFGTCASNSCRFVRKEDADEAHFSKLLKEEYEYLSSTIFLTNSMLSRL